MVHTVSAIVSVSSHAKIILCAWLLVVVQSSQRPWRSKCLDRKVMQNHKPFRGPVSVPSSGPAACTVNVACNIDVLCLCLLHRNWGLCDDVNAECMRLMCVCSKRKEKTWEDESDSLTEKARHSHTNERVDRIDTNRICSVFYPFIKEEYKCLSLFIWTLILFISHDFCFLFTNPIYHSSSLFASLTFLLLQTMNHLSSCPSLCWLHILLTATLLPPHTRF